MGGRDGIKNKVNGDASCYLTGFEKWFQQEARMNNTGE